jgi:manganese/iron transport system permease protein
MRWLSDPLSAPFMQRALVAVVLLAIAGGLLGTWVVLRRLAFFTHATGSATFPGLVVAGPWGIAPPVAALGAGLVFAVLIARLIRDRVVAADAATGLVLAGALALGAVLASDVYPAGAGVDRLLFGTLLGLDDRDLWLAAAAAAAALLATAVCARTWLASGFDPAAAGVMGVPVRAGDTLLLALLAGTVVATLPAVGALLVTTLLVTPAATARLLTRSLPALLSAAVGLAALEGVGGLLLAYHLDFPPGPAIALLGGALFVAASVTRLRTAA